MSVILSLWLDLIRQPRSSTSISHDHLILCYCLCELPFAILLRLLEEERPELILRPL
jgi:hypothetical protein